MAGGRNPSAVVIGDRTLGRRALTVIVALLLGFIGLFMWSYEETYGGRSGLPQYVIEEDVQLNEVLVYRVDERTGQQVLVFEGSERTEADAFVENQRDLNYTGAILFYVGAVVFLIYGVSPPYQRVGPGPETGNDSSSMGDRGGQEEDQDGFRTLRVARGR